MTGTNIRLELNLPDLTLEELNKILEPFKCYAKFANELGDLHDFKIFGTTNRLMKWFKFYILHTPYDEPFQNEDDAAKFEQVLRGRSRLREYRGLIRKYNWKDERKNKKLCKFRAWMQQSEKRNPAKMDLDYVEKRDIRKNVNEVTSYLDEIGLAINDLYNYGTPEDKKEITKRIKIFFDNIDPHMIYVQSCSKQEAEDIIKTYYPYFDDNKVELIVNDLMQYFIDSKWQKIDSEKLTKTIKDLIDYEIERGNL